MDQNLCAIKVCTLVSLVMLIGGSFLLLDDNSVYSNEYIIEIESNQNHVDDHTTTLDNSDDSPPEESEEAEELEDKQELDVDRSTDKQETIQEKEEKPSTQNTAKKGKFLEKLKNVYIGTGIAATTLVHAETIMISGSKIISKFIELISTCC